MSSSFVANARYGTIVEYILALPKNPRINEKYTRNNTGSSHIAFLNAVKAAIIMTDGEGLITYWNPFSEELYGWPSKEVVGRNIMKITVTPN